MPQATDKLRGLMALWFGDCVDDKGPQEFLRSHGYKLCTGWVWQLPVDAHTVSCYEAACISFLIQEWDFGGISSIHDERPIMCLCGKSEGGGICYSV